MGNFLKDYIDYVPNEVESIERAHLTMRHTGYYQLTGQLALTRSLRKDQYLEL